MTGARHAAVGVSVPARLHLGFLDLEGGLGRQFGSLGITLDGPRTTLRVSPARETAVTGPDAARARRYLSLVTEHYGTPPRVRLEIEEAIPAHSGLGSGTQLALAVGGAATRLAGLEVDAAELAVVLDRGSRSGIGIGAFQQGGILLDGGRGKSGRPPPIISRFPFPEDWRVLLIFDHAGAGIHGEAEVQAFQGLPVFPADSAAHLCRQVLMTALPALAEQDLEGFGTVVAELQRVVGDHFAPAQGGRFASPRVTEVLAWLEAEGVTGLGQSSWGPTGFALVGSETEGRALLETARARWPEAAGLSFELRRGINHGAKVEVESLVRAAP